MKKQVNGRLLAYLKPYRWLMAAGLVFAFASVLLTLLGPVLIGRAVDAIAGPGRVNAPLVLRYLVWLAVSALLAALAQWEMHVITRKISSYAARDLRTEAFVRLNHMPLSYLDSHAHGDLISRLINDADLVSEGFLQGMTQLLPGVATIAGTLVIMLWLNPFMALVVVLVTPLSILFAGFVAKHTAEYFRRQSAAQGALSGFVKEMVAGQNIVTSFGGEEHAFGTLDALTDTLYDTGLKSVFYSSVTNPGTRFVNAVVYAAVGVIGAVNVVSGGLTVGLLSSFLAYANQYTKPFNEVSGVLTQLQAAQAGAERLFALLDAEIEPEDAPNAAKPERCAGEVRLSHVDFSYVPQTPLIENLNLVAQPGQRIAIVGPTGCGKTTLINLLMRFYEVNAGEICVDGVPVLQIQRDALRGLYGMVLQETWLKHATVRDNIAYGKPDAAEEEVVAAAKEAHAHSFIKRLPQGYDTMVAEGGGNLSAGQKQLLCIARILLSKPDMLILDEATSSIDTRTEMLVQAAFERLMQGRTSFVVAHRLSTIQTADMILVMRAGHIVEQGTHAQLLAQNGFYATLYRSQFAPV